MTQTPRHLFGSFSCLLSEGPLRQTGTSADGFAVLAPASLPPPPALTFPVLVTLPCNKAIIQSLQSQKY